MDFRIGRYEYDNSPAKSANDVLNRESQAETSHKLAWFAGGWANWISE
jgi:hypothetical protein